MSGQHQSSPQTKGDAKPQTAAMENFVRLQEHQEEFLKWLEASEKKAAVDRYAFKKIR